MVVEARVVETNKGGLSIDVNGIRGFHAHQPDRHDRVENAEQFVNQRLLCLVTEVICRGPQFGREPPCLLEKEREENRENFGRSLRRAKSARESFARCANSERLSISAAPRLAAHQRDDGRASRMPRSGPTRAKVKVPCSKSIATSARSALDCVS